jgi:GT2 family glycosyltransferase
MQILESPAPAPASLSVGIVTYRPDLELLQETAESLAAAVTEAERELLITSTRVVVVDNTGPGDRPGPREALNAVRHAVGPALGEAGVPVEYRGGHGNVGYGAGHNLALADADSDYHLVLNPDVVLDHYALARALRFMQTHPDVGMLAPAVSAPDHSPQYLAKRYPAVLDLALRGFAPGSVQRLFRARLERYEMRDRAGAEPVDDVEVASGCFMFLRRALARSLGGFDPAFFLYFEDFDLCVRLRAQAKIALVPGVKIVHHGGFAARKGLRHVAWFGRGALRFYGKHGWRFV